MSPERTVSEIVANATHKWVNEAYLTKLKPDGETQYLHSYPLIEYLRDGEQPHFIFESPGEPLTVEGSEQVAPPVNDGTGMTLHMVTDMWWLTVAANREEDQWLGVPLSDMNGVSIEKRHDNSYNVSISTETYGIIAHVSKVYDSSTINHLRSWLIEHSGADGTYKRSWGSPKNSSSGVMSAVGVNGKVTLHKDRLEISRENIGVIHKMQHGFKGDKEIPYESITSIQLRKPSTATRGYIQFGQSGYSESDDGLLDATSDENTVLFDKGSLRDFEELRAKVRELSKDDVEASTGNVDGAMEKLRERYAAGEIDEEEYEQRKEILQRD